MFQHKPLFSQLMQIFTSGRCGRRHLKGLIYMTREYYGWMNELWLGDILTLEMLQDFLTRWRRVTHICVIKLTIIGSDNGLLSDRCQTIIWSNAGVNWTLRNKVQWNSNLNSYIFIQENALRNNGHFFFGLNVIRSHQPFLNITSSGQEQWHRITGIQTHFENDISKFFCHIMACHLFSGMPLSEPMMDDLVSIGPLEKHGFISIPLMLLFSRYANCMQECISHSWTWLIINPCHVEFYLGNIKVYLHFLLFDNSEMAQVVENHSW